MSENYNGLCKNIRIIGMNKSKRVICQECPKVCVNLQTDVR